MFITLEGIEGSGKTTQMAHIARFLEQHGRTCVQTREPGGTPIGEKLRAILLDPANRHLAPGAELLLYTADRVQHVQEVVAPALDAGHTVLCDRFFDATLVYQGYARGLDRGLIQTLHDLLLDGLRPDLTLLLDLDPALGLRRAWRQLDSGSRGAGESRFEKEALAFHDRVRAGYLELARAAPERIAVLDAAQSEAAVREAIFDILTRHLNRLTAPGTAVSR
jgi:dTMP kinase